MTRDKRLREKALAYTKRVWGEDNVNDAMATLGFEAGYRAAMREIKRAKGGER